jgi:hypothetical protein
MVDVNSRLSGVGLALYALYSVRALRHRPAAREVLIAVCASGSIGRGRASVKWVEVFTGVLDGGSFTGFCTRVLHGGSARGFYTVLHGG